MTVEVTVAPSGTIAESHGVLREVNRASYEPKISMILQVSCNLPDEEIAAKSRFQRNPLQVVEKTDVLLVDHDVDITVS
ncbi:hypothetical protein PUN28_010559 [Cardiocondyla obscurior]|uniref:Uncharacterized protein n=1 Tax=Cardiocondyla obscurior TaxID=286306 RepID=A0AAW2FJ14_9HYME